MKKPFLHLRFYYFSVMVAQEALAAPDPQFAAAGTFTSNTANVGGSNAGGTVIG